MVFAVSGEARVGAEEGSVMDKMRLLAENKELRRKVQFFYNKSLTLERANIILQRERDVLKAIVDNMVSSKKGPE